MRPQDNAWSCWINKLREQISTIHYDGVTMSTMTSKITSLTIVYSIVYSDADQRKHQSSALLALCEGNSPVKDKYPSQRASNAENVSIWWRHHVTSNNPQRSMCGQANNKMYPRYACCVDTSELNFSHSRVRQTLYIIYRIDTNVIESIDIYVDWLLSIGLHRRLQQNYCIENNARARVVMFYLLRGCYFGVHFPSCKPRPRLRHISGDKVSIVPTVSGDEVFDSGFLCISLIHWPLEDLEINT